MLDSTAIDQTYSLVPSLHTPQSRMGRLAARAKRLSYAVQLAMFGYGAQAVITGEGPYKNLVDHVANPTKVNLLTNFAHPAL